MGFLSFIRISIVMITSASANQCSPDNPVEQTFSLDSKILSEQISVVHYSFSTSKDIPVIYITDGQKMIDNGALERIKTLTSEEKIPKAEYVFVSTIATETKEDKRNTYFFCNADYIRFFEEELVPRIEGAPSRKAKNRSLIGISFGGLNAAYFSGKTDLFQNYALLSPITYPCDDALKAIAFSKNKNLNIIISTGKNDAEKYVTPLANLYTSKEYRVKNIITNGAHDFENWNGQLQEVLNTLLQ